MCHSTGSRPPAPPVVTGEVAEHRLSAYRATPTIPNGRNVVILPDVRGLHPFYEDLAHRFAEAGFHTMVIDFYGRSAGTLPRDDTFDPMTHMELLEARHVDADVSAAVVRLREEHPGPVFTVGFCLGGGHSWRQAATDLGFDGAGKEYEMHVYDGAPHSFFDVTFADWGQECADAWHRILDFTFRHADRAAA